jgi:hypothetical protein
LIRGIGNPPLLRLASRRTAFQSRVLLSEAATSPKMKTAYHRHRIRLCDTCLFVATATDPDILPQG